MARIPREIRPRSLWTIRSHITLLYYFIWCWIYHIMSYHPHSIPVHTICHQTYSLFLGMITILWCSKYSLSWRLVLQSILITIKTFICLTHTFVLKPLCLSWKLLVWPPKYPHAYKWSLSWWGLETSRFAKYLPPHNLTWECIVGQPWWNP